MQISVTMNRGDITKVLLLFIVLGLSECRGSSSAYRAKRYGSYYKSTYYSYSGVGFARYSRVYSRVRNLYAGYYSYMFQWMNTNDYTVYKSTPSGSISVCKNYEANANGTYMGVFTCPLPFVPEDLAYCCGETNAEYCCRFWDVPLNIAAVSVGSLMGLCLFIITVYIIIQLCRQKYRTDAEKRERKASRRFGNIKRSITVAGMWSSDRASNRDLLDPSPHSSMTSLAKVRAVGETTKENGTSR